MTAASVDVIGTRRTVGLKPADTNEAVLYAANNQHATLVGLIIANNTGGAIAATVQWHDGTTDFDIYAAKSIAANDSLIPDIFIPLLPGWSVKVTSATGNALTFTAVVIEHSGALRGAG